jgi:archaeosortase B (VPXXXP-CTERM-specific)
MSKSKGKKGFLPPQPEVGKKVAALVLSRPLRFCALFLLTLVLLLGLYILGLALWKPKVDLVITGLMASVAEVVGLFLKFLGLPCTVQDNLIMMDTLNLEIILQCTGFYETLIVAAAVLAYPSPLKIKLKGVMLFVALIYVVNLARMILLALIGRHSMQLFNLVHLYVLEITSILIIIGMWLLWIWKLSGHEKQ